MPFDILYHSDCLQRDIRKLDRPLLKRIRQTIESRLMIAPMDFGKPLRHTKEGLWALRVGDWRILYKITGNQVWILRIGHRSEIYKLLF